METNKTSTNLMIPYDGKSEIVRENAPFTFYEQFLEHYKQERNPARNTIIALKYIIPKFLEFYYAKHGENLNLLTPEDIVSYLNNLPIRTSSRKMHLRFIMLFFNCLFKYKLIEVKLPSISYKGSSDIPRAIQKGMSEKEIFMMEKNSKLFSEMEWLIFWLIRRRPLRIGEVAKLKISDIDFAKNEFQIVKSKNYCSRKIPLPDNPSNWIEKLQIWIKDKPIDSFMFNIRERQLNIIIQNLCKKANIILNGRNSHAFRHFVIMEMHRKGIPLAVIAYMAGNTPQTIEEHYLKDISEDDTIRAAFLMDHGKKIDRL